MSNLELLLKKNHLHLFPIISVFNSRLFSFPLIGSFCYLFFVGAWKKNLRRQFKLVLFWIMSRKKEMGRFTFP